MRNIREYNIESHIKLHRPADEIALELDEEGFLDRLGSQKFKFKEDQNATEDQMNFNGFSVRKGDFVPEYTDTDGRQKRKSASL